VSPAFGFLTLPRSTRCPTFCRHMPPQLIRPLLLCVMVLATGAGCQSTRPARPQAIIASALARRASPELLDEARESFFAAVAGDRAALPRADQILSDLGGEESDRPEVIAYLGATRLLEAARAPLPWDKAALAREGLALEDRAVAAAPDNLEVRFLRGVTNYELPRFLGRWSLAVADLTRVAQVAEREVADGHLDPRAAAADLDYYGKLREQRFDAAGAINAWRAALRISPASPGGQDAAKHLAEHQVPPDIGA